MDDLNVPREQNPQVELMKLFKDLRNFTATPEMVLQLLSSPCYLAKSYGSEDDDPRIIFVECMQFMIKSLPDACIEGIWEIFFKKIMSYSTNISGGSMHRIKRHKFWKNIRKWLYEALSSPNKCPNPYVRLEIFRLHRIRGYNHQESIPWEKVTDTFIKTVCEIQPNRLYPLGDEDDVLFEPADFSATMYNCWNTWTLTDRVTNELRKFDSLDEYIKHSIIPWFLGHCIQIMGVLCIIAFSNPDSEKSEAEIEYFADELFNRFIEHFFKDYDKDPLENEPSIKIFRYVTERPPVSFFASEVARDISAAITNSRKRQSTEYMLTLRNLIMGDMETNLVNELPRLVMARQVECLKISDRQFLGFKEITSSYDDHSKDTPTKVTTITSAFDRYIRPLEAGGPSPYIA